jgi:serine phosphatase RsbU (regulator of sigma subunit)
MSRRIFVMGHPNTLRPATRGKLALGGGATAEYARVMSRPDHPGEFSPDDAYELISVRGDDERSLILLPPDAATIGRLSSHDLTLPGETVSRFHASLQYHPNEKPSPWSLVDEHSKLGTRLNGIALTPLQEYPIKPNDLIEIGPWTLRVMLRRTRPDPRSISTFDDEAAPGASVRTLGETMRRGLSRERLSLLLHCAEDIHAASDEERLAEAVVHAAWSGTGFANVALVRPLAKDGSVDLLAWRGDMQGQGGTPTLSRSLLVKASAGTPTVLHDATKTEVTGQSIAELGIDHAICVPLCLGSSVAGYLYLDNRSVGAPSMGALPDAADFASMLGQLASLALSNLMRVDLERRQAQMKVQLQAAAEMQRLILPPRTIVHSPFRVTGECRPGEYVGGDFFNALPLGEGQLAVLLGDVTGHGLPASVVMALSHGYLHRALSAGATPAEAVSDVNEFLVPRCEAGVFVTLWLGLFNAADRTLTYVDAGHGYALHGAAGEVPAFLRARAQGPPVGIEEGFEYRQRTAALRPGDRIIIVSDGVVEQPMDRSTTGSSVERFGEHRLLGAMPAVLDGDTDEVAMIFDAVTMFGGTTRLDDDATAVVVQWDG